MLHASLQYNQQRVASLGLQDAYLMYSSHYNLTSRSGKLEKLDGSLSKTASQKRFLTPRNQMFHREARVPGQHSSRHQRTAWTTSQPPRIRGMRGRVDQASFALDNAQQEIPKRYNQARCLVSRWLPWGQSAREKSKAGLGAKVEQKVSEATAFFPLPEIAESTIFVHVRFHRSAGISSLSPRLSSGLTTLSEIDTVSRLLPVCCTSDGSNCPWLRYRRADGFELRGGAMR